MIIMMNKSRSETSRGKSPRVEKFAGSNPRGRRNNHVGQIVSPNCPTQYNAMSYNIT